MITRIREVRRAKGMTLDDVARACSPATTPQTIGRLETGTRTVSVGWLNRIAQALGVAAGRVPPGDVPALFEGMRLARVRTVVRRSAEGRGGAHGPAPVRAAMRAGLRVAPGAVKARMVEGLQGWPGY